MLRKTGLLAAVGSSLAAAVAAHNGASGVVMERMVGMAAMRDVMSGLAPMMQGEVPYDVRAVQEGAARLIAHSGDNMNRLFPEGAPQAASFARPEIWEEWEDFAALSEQLKAYALGMGVAAPNGLAAPAPSTGAASAGEAMDHGSMRMEAPAAAPAPSEAGAMDHSMMGMGGPATTGAEAAPDAPSASRRGVAELMGVARPEPAAPRATGTSSEEGIDFAAMAADDAFEMVGQTCSACHARYRSGG